MKAKLYIVIISAVLLPGLLAEAQIADARNFGNDDGGLVINNYYNYDYFYASRINRFHRSYATFTYYSPVYTDSYWYTYNPFTWGLSIYGGVLGFGVSYNYPIYYNYGWNYPYYGWDYPYFGGYSYWGYDPFYYTWYSPIVLNIRIGGWGHRNFYSWRNNYRWYNSYRPAYNTYNNYKKYYI